MTKLALSALTDVLTLDLPVPVAAAAESARQRQMELTKPPGSLGRLEELAEFMAGWQGTGRPQVNRAQALVFAGNHGVCAQGVNPFPQEVTAQMVANFEAGGAAINQLCREAGADLSVIALDLNHPTGDFTEGPAMSEDTCIAAMLRGAAAVDPDADVLLLGEMGIGNSTVAAAQCLGAFGGSGADWVGRGTGADAERLRLKARVIERAVSRHAGVDAIGKLAALGGREQAAICGAVLEARLRRIPVMLDGFICSAAVAPLMAARPETLDHCLIGHRSAEAGHRKLTEALGRAPLLDLGMALGEGTGAALALQVLKGALACHNGMATFAEAGVSGA